MGARTSSAGHYNKTMRKAKVKRLIFRERLLFSALIVLLLLPIGVAIGQDATEPSKKTDAPISKAELENLKTEWEAVREQQVQMIREKEDELEKLKEEIFSKMKTQRGSAVSSDREEFEAQKSAFLAERQKFFVEMSRQKESLHQLQASLDEKAKQLEAERDRFEQEKKTATR